MATVKVTKKVQVIIRCSLTVPWDKENWAVEYLKEHKFRYTNSYHRENDITIMGERLAIENKESLDVN